MKTGSVMFIFLLGSLTALAQTEDLPKTVAGFPVNYDEKSIPAYTLPDLLLLKNGGIVNDSTTWKEKRRPELLKEIEEIQFGKMPPPPSDISFKIVDEGKTAFEGKAIRKQVTIYFTEDTTDHKMDLLLYIPAEATGPVPLFFNVSFVANSQVADDPEVKVGKIWNREGQKILADQPSRFPKINIEQFVEAGFGFATVYYGDIEPDFKDGIEYGIRSLYLENGQSKLKPDEWGTISAWAWGLSRAMDYFEKDTAIDATRVAIHGVSRLGKTVLWTGAKDTRFKMVIASCSGEGGAALARRDYGENIKHLSDTSRYSYQFAANYNSSSDHVDDLPYDAHSIVALMAPRPLLLQTGNSDYWSDPKGELLAANEAKAVYELFGESGPSTIKMPAAGDTSLLFNKLGYFMHEGGHGTVPSDFPIFISYMKKYL